MNANTRRAIQDEFMSDSIDAADTMSRDDRWALVEKSRHNGARYITWHASQEAMNAYYANQEYPEDWEPVAVIDADTLTRYEPMVSYQLTLHPLGTMKVGG